VSGGEQVGAQGSPVGVEALRLLPETEEDLLHDLLGPALVTEHPPGQAVHRSAVASVHLGEGVVAPATDRDDQRGITDAAQVGFRHNGKGQGAQAARGVVDARARRSLYW
jgi:hypothetical protein